MGHVMSKPQPTVTAILIERYVCRDSEGGCGAERGEQCKTLQRHKPTACHADRWRQWELEGHPGAWWHGVNDDERQPPIGSAEDLIDGIERSLAIIERNIKELKRLRDA
jgi:hypothetical protein